jgi:hypothetical protein
MKTDIAAYVATCDVCRRIEAEHHHPAGLLKPLDVPIWKWDNTTSSWVFPAPRKDMMLFG